MKIPMEDTANRKKKTGWETSGSSLSPVHVGQRRGGGARIAIPGSSWRGKRGEYYLSITPLGVGAAVLPEFTRIYQKKAMGRIPLAVLLVGQWALVGSWASSSASPLSGVSGLPRRSALAEASTKKEGERSR